MTAATTEPEPKASPPAPLHELYAQMALIRAFETRVAELYRDGEIPGFVHTSLGQEGVAAGVGAALREDDYLATTHRGHGHVLAKGTDVDGMMAELFARGSGLCHGKGGSMHVSDPGRGILGANAIVGASLPLAVGAALSSKLRRQDRVAVAFFGEGAVNQGAFHEAVNLGAIWDLPVLLVCENNVYAEFTDSRRMTRVLSVAERAKSYGVEAVVVDGNDVEAVFAATSDGVDRCRDARGPVLIEAETYRWHGHYEGDAQPYKPAEESESWKVRDPLIRAGRTLVERGQSTDEDLQRLQAEARTTIDEAVDRARSADGPDPQEAYANVFVS